MNKKFKVQPLKGVEIHNAKSVGTRTVNLLMGEHQGEYVRGDIMDANAVVQAIDEVRGGIDSGHDSLAKLAEEVKTNATVINGTITYANKIAADLQKESEARTSEDDKLNTAISNEATARANAVKAVDDKLTAETTARTNADKEINKKIDVINGDSNTDGSIKKAIADVIDAAPEAYDTLKEIADKLNNNDDLHAVIQEAITEKASNEALTNEVNRATAKEEEIVQSVKQKQNQLQLLKERYYNDTHSEYIASVNNYFIDNKKDGNDSRTVGGTFFDANSYITNSYYGSNRNAILCGYDPRVFAEENNINNTSFDDQFTTIYSSEHISKGRYNIMPLYFLFDIYGCSSIEYHKLHHIRGIIGGPTPNPSDTDVFNTNGGVVDTTKFIKATDDNKISESYIPTTVALKTDLSEYIKTKDADSKYLSKTNYTVTGNYTSYSGWIKATNLSSTVNSNFASISKTNGSYLAAFDEADKSDTKVYNTNGGLCDLKDYAKLTDGKISSDLLPESGSTSILDSVIMPTDSSHNQYVYVGKTNSINISRPKICMSTGSISSSGSLGVLNNQNVLQIGGYTTNEYNGETLANVSGGQTVATFTNLGVNFPRCVEFGTEGQMISINVCGDNDDTMDNQYYIKLHGCDGNGSIQLDYVGSGQFAYQDKGVYLTDGTIAPINYKNGLAKLDANGNINSLIKPADISEANKGDANGIKSVNADTATTSDLATAFNKLLEYTQRLENALINANLLTSYVISE